MRTLDRNKSTVWTVEPIGRTAIFDDEGFDTGETVINFGTPKKVRMALYPASGAIVEQVFGKDCSFDLIATSCDIELTKDTLVFMSEPLTNYSKTYDYSVSSIKHSLNNFNYGFKERT